MKTDTFCPIISISEKSPCAKGFKVGVVLYSLERQCDAVGALAMTFRVQLESRSEAGYRTGDSGMKNIAPYVRPKQDCIW